MMVQMGKTVIIDLFSEARFILTQQMIKDVLIPGVQVVAQTSSPAGNKETGNEPKDQQMKPRKKDGGRYERKRFIETKRNIQQTVSEKVEMLFVMQMYFSNIGCLCLLQFSTTMIE